jgi:hypothetical protein
MALTGEIFHQVHMPWAKPVDRAIAQPDFHLAREGNDVLASRAVMPVAEVARLSLPEDDAFSALELGQVGVGRQV